MKAIAVIAITILTSSPVIAANSDGGGLGGTGQGNQSSSSSGGNGGHTARTRAGVNVDPIGDAIVGGAQLAYGLLTGTAGPGASGGGVRAAEPTDTREARGV